MSKRERAPGPGRPFQRNYVATNDISRDTANRPAVQPVDDLTAWPAVYSAKARPVPERLDIDEAARWEMIADLQFQRLVRHLHALGPRAVAEYLGELAAERALRTSIEAKLRSYSRLTREQVEVAGSSDFWKPPLVLAGGTGGWPR